MLDLGSLGYTHEEILSKRNQVAQGLITKSAHIKGADIDQISSTDLKLLFMLYDEIFFQHQFAQEYKGKIKFSLSSRLIKTAGKTLVPKHIAQLKPEELTLEIRIGTEFFFKYNEIERKKSVAGIVTSSALEALQLVFEHELCHVIEFVNFKTSNCKQKRFKTISGNLFGHTESTHQLPTPRQILQEKYGFKIGDTVTFNFEKQKLEGVLYKVNKRATVMVRDKDGSYADKQGNRFAKYYVPIAGLKK